MTGMAFVRWLGPLGGAEGRFATASRKLTQENPRAFVVPTLVWLVVNALFATRFVALGSGVLHPISSPSGAVAGLYTGVALLLLLMGTGQWFALGWIARWRLARLRAHGMSLAPEPAVLTMTPGIWVSLTAAHVVAAVLLIMRMANLRLGGLAFARLMLIPGIILAFSAMIQALAAYYRQPFMMFWRTIAWPVAILLIPMFGVIAMISFARYKEQVRAHILARESLPYTTHLPVARPHHHIGLARSARRDAATAH